MQVLKDEIRNRILVVAETLFYEKGFSETTTREIASHAKISVSNLYLYYKNKEELFSELLETFYHSFSSGVSKFLNHPFHPLDLEQDLSFSLSDIIFKNRRKFVLLLDKSLKTKYAHYKEELISQLAFHIKESLASPSIPKEILSLVLAQNFVEGLIQIAKQELTEEQQKNCITFFVTHHLNGMRYLP